MNDVLPFDNGINVKPMKRMKEIEVVKQRKESLIATASRVASEYSRKIELCDETISELESHICGIVPTPKKKEHNMDYKKELQELRNSIEELIERKREDVKRQYPVGTLVKDGTGIVVGVPITHEDKVMVQVCTFGTLYSGPHIAYVDVEDIQ